MKENLSQLNPVIVALDVNNLKDALEIARKLRGLIDIVKIGLEFFVAEGPDCVKRLKEEGFEVFLDLKIHDIPTTVERTCAVLSRLEPVFITVHALGGEKMLKAALRGVRNFWDTGELKTRLAGVTVLTSLDDAAAEEIGLAYPVPQQVVRLARLARDSGLDALVASPLEIRAIRENLGSEIIIITPGIRSASFDKDDQVRCATPAYAIESGADFIVVGRQVTRADDVYEAARSIAEEVEIARGRNQKMA